MFFKKKKEQEIPKPELIKSYTNVHVFGIDEVEDKIKKLEKMLSKLKLNITPLAIEGSIEKENQKVTIETFYVDCKPYLVNVILQLQPSDLQEISKLKNDRELALYLCNSGILDQLNLNDLTQLAKEIEESSQN
mgnify:CR=1 FL=1